MLEVLLGGVAAFLFIGSTRGVARKLGSRRFEPVVYALGLVVAALIYLGFSLFTPGSPWLWIEIGGVVIFGALANPMGLPGIVARDISVQGSLWFSRETPSLLTSLIANGSLAVDRITSHSFALDDIEAAMQRAKQPIAPFEQVVVNP